MAGFPADPSKLDVGIAYGADISADPTTLTYTSITTDVEPQVLIRRGRIADSPTTSPTSIDCSFLNPGGIFSPQNITGPQYGNLRINTPIRVRVDTTGTGVYSTRACAGIASFNPTWDGPNIADKMRVPAKGILGRLGVARDTTYSPMQRSYRAANPRAYWPLESGLGAGVNGLSSLTVTSAAQPAFTSSAISVPGSAGTVDLRNGSILTATIDPTPFSPTTWQIEFNGGFVGGSGSSVATFQVNMDSGTAIPVLFDPLLADGTFHNIALLLYVTGGNLVYDRYREGVFITTVTIGPVSNFPIGRPTQIMINPFAITGNGLPLICHFALFSAFSSPASRALAEAAFSGETAAARVTRLCAEQGLVVDVAAGRTETMGVQANAATLGALLRECEDADDATLIDRTNGKLGFTPNVTRYNVGAAMTLTYPYDVSSMLPVEDDRIANDLTVTEPSGSIGAYVQTTGLKGSSQQTGAGDYPAALSKNIQAAGNAVHHARWLARLGAVEEPRYTIGVNLRDRPNQIASWLNCDIGSHVVVNNPPAIHSGPAPLSLVIEGYQELIDAVQWEIVLYCRPYRPYRVFQIQTGMDNTSRIASGTQTTVNVQRAPTDTSFAVTSTGPGWVDSATYPTRFPILVVVAGEVMSCTNISGTGASQTMTMTRGVHGVVKTIPAGSVVEVWRPGVIAL